MSNKLPTVTDIELPPQQDLDPVALASNSNSNSSITSSIGKKLIEGPMMTCIKNEVFSRLILAHGLVNGDYEKDVFGRPTQAFYKACQLIFELPAEKKTSNQKQDNVYKNLTHLFEETILSDLKVISKDIMVELSN